MILGVRIMEEKINKCSDFTQNAANIISLHLFTISHGSLDILFSYQCLQHTHISKHRSLMIQTTPLVVTISAFQKGEKGLVSLLNCLLEHAILEHRFCICIYMILSIYYSKTMIVIWL